MAADAFTALMFRAYPDMEWPAFNSTSATSVRKEWEASVGNANRPETATPKAAIKPSITTCPTACAHVPDKVEIRVDVLRMLSAEGWGAQTRPVQVLYCTDTQSDA